MLFSVSRLAVVLSVFALGHGLPNTTPAPTHSVSKRTFNCNKPVQGLSQAHCNHMSAIGMYAQGVNSYSNNGQIWIGSDGPNIFTFTANAGVDVNLIFWANPTGDYSSSFMNIRQPQISYSLAEGQQLTVSMANGLSGAGAGLYNDVTPLTPYGQIDNTWGEVTTGAYGTVDVSREVNMGGNGMSITLHDSGCVSDMNTCVFQCRSANTCGDSGSYTLVNCAAGSQSGATFGLYGADPSGGCQGFSNRGQMSVSFTN